MKDHSVFQQPTDAELEILQILWANGPCTVRFVNEQLNNFRVVGYTTTLKTMQIMHDKHLVTRNEKGRSHIYSTNIEENAIQNRLIDKILNSAFKGSATNLVMQTLGNHKTSKKELEQIKKLIDNIENNQQND